MAKTLNFIKKFGNGVPALQEVMEQGRVYTETVGDVTYTFGIDGESFVVQSENNVDGSANSIQFNKDTGFLFQGVTSDGEPINVFLEANPISGFNYETSRFVSSVLRKAGFLIPPRSIDGVVTFQIPSNKTAGTYTLATLDDITSGGGSLISLTTTEILALTPTTGKLYYNNTINEVVYYNGTAWKKIVNLDM